jgi:hypothetical protein
LTKDLSCEGRQKSVYGFFKGSLEFFEGEEKMVVGADHHCADHFRLVDRAGWHIRAGPFYLYIILMMMQKERSGETVLVIVLGLVVLYWLKRKDALLLSALAIGGVALLVPAAARGIHQGWMKLSQMLGNVSGKVLLTLVYFFVLAPLSLLARWMGKISILKKGAGNTHFKERNHDYTKEDIIHPW